MRINIALDPIDPTDPLAIDPVGTITLISGQNTLSEPYVYLDSWLNALREGVRKMTVVDKAEIDLIEEPDPLIFERTDGGIRISFKEKFVTVENVEEMDIAVAAALKELVDTQIFPNK
jgi:hypothetical protein